MNKQYQKTITLLLSMTLMLITTMNAYASKGYPVEYTLTESEIVRFAALLEAANENPPLSIGVTNLTFIQRANETQIWKIQNPGKTPDTSYGLPTAQDISYEIAVYYAYKAVEEKSGYGDDILALFYPYPYLDVTDADNPFWYVEMLPMKEGVFDEFGMFFVKILARTGVVESCIGVEDAVG